MLETAAVPILVKAVDFLFDECKKILEERRERRKKQGTEIGQSDITKDVISSDNSSITGQNIIRSKDSALHTPVDKSAWLRSEERVNNLLSLLNIRLANYHHVNKQFAYWGDALVPQIIVNNLKNEEDKIIEIIKELQDILSIVYAKKIIVLDSKDLQIPIDEVPDS